MERHTATGAPKYGCWYLTQLHHRCACSARDSELKFVTVADGTRSPRRQASRWLPLLTAGAAKCSAGLARAREGQPAPDKTLATLLRSKVGADRGPDYRRTPVRRTRPSVRQ